MSNVNLNLYRIFCKVAQSKSYSEAAEKLGSSVGRQHKCQAPSGQNFPV